VAHLHCDCLAAFARHCVYCSELPDIDATGPVSTGSHLLARVLREQRRTNDKGVREIRRWCDGWRPRICRCAVAAESRWTFCGSWPERAAYRHSTDWWNIS